MSLDLINVGAEANDGTGDTPRAAFTKVNAAIAALNDLPASTDYSADIAALEAVQGSQAAAILALESDVADQGAAIAAIDGFSGDYNDLTNRPSLFSGAYGDLSGRPIIPFGFTYDQTAEPVAPTAGQTWRERSAGGLIVGDWEWSGSLWMGVDSKSVVLSALSNAIPFRLPHLTFGGVLFTSATLTYRAGVADASNYLSSLDFGVKNGTANATSINTVIYNFSDSIRSFGNSQGINITVSSDVYLAPLINTQLLGISLPTTVGTYNPAGIGLCLRYREVRP